MIILAADTSTTRGSVAVTARDGVVHTRGLDPDQPHSQTLLPGIEELLAGAGLSRRDVEAVAVGTGPGAFTGLRVGLATLKGWSAAARLPMVPVVSLDALALPGLRDGSPVLTLMDARKGELYAACYPDLDDHGLPRRKGEIALIPREEAAGWIERTGYPAAQLVGTGTWQPKGGEAARVKTGVGGVVPSAAEVLALAAILAQLGRTVDAAAVVPTYVRPPDALPPRAGTIINVAESRDPGQ